MKLDETLRLIQPTNKKTEELSRKRWLTVAKPLMSLGRLEELISKIAAITGDAEAPCGKKGLIIMCADNGVVDEGVTQCGREITAMVTENFRKRAASVCIMAKRAGCDIFPVDIGVERDVDGVSVPEEKVRYCTGNIAKGPAMTRGETVRAIEVGINKTAELKNAGYELIATGEMGIGNTTTTAAVLSVLLGEKPERMTGKGAGLSGEGLKRKIAAVKSAIEVNEPDPEDVIDVLSKVGGLDIAGLCGVFLGCAALRLPVIIDGVISAAAGLCAAGLSKTALGYMLPSHISKEPAFRLAIDALGLVPYIDCGMFLGEGSGAVALMPLIDMAAGVYHEMQTFSSWDREGYKLFD